jgi:sigma-B regulation protein RsbU (phosphoserine phosphatase)
MHPELLSWIRDDLAKAREMLERFSPPPLPISSGFECYAMCRQLVEIGGDYYDFVVRPDEGFVLAIGDVSGKAISAALMLSNLRAILHNELQRHTDNLVGLMTKLNRLVAEASPMGRYITLFYGQYDARTSRLHYVNAGHNYPLLFRRLSKNGAPRELLIGGVPLGIMAEPPQPYEQGREIIRPGDVLVAYTDGIVEVGSAAGKEWGLDSLISLVQDQIDHSAKEIGDSIVAAVDKFGEGNALNDDMTLLVLKALA